MEQKYFETHDTGNYFDEMSLCLFEVLLYLKVFVRYIHSNYATRHKMSPRN